MKSHVSIICDFVFLFGFIRNFSILVEKFSSICVGCISYIFL